MPEIYGVDISNWQKGFDVKALVGEGFDFIFAKCSQGSGFVDPFYAGFCTQAREAGLLFSAYHFVDTSDPAAQARNIDRAVRDKSIPLMLDLEPADSRPTMLHFDSVKREVEKLGYKVRFSYIPRWYWEQIGRPDLSHVPGLFASNYVTGSGYASTLASKISRASQMTGYGNATPVILQYTDSGVVSNFTGVDCDIFYGDLSELKKLFGINVAAPALKELSDEPPVFSATMASVHNPRHKTTDRELLENVNQQLTGAKTLVYNNRTLDLKASYPGWEQLGGKTLVDATADVLKKLDDIIAGQTAIMGFLESHYKKDG